MAISNLIQGSSITWRSSGGTGAITPTSLTSGSAREGAKLDLYDATYGLPERVVPILQSAVASAATTGRALRLYLGFSPTATAGSDNPGNLTGADAALSNVTELTGQLLLAGELQFSNARGTNIQRVIMTPFVPILRYLTPLLHNDTGVSLSATAGDHIITMIPFYRQIV